MKAVLREGTHPVVEVIVQLQDSAGVIRVVLIDVFQELDLIKTLVQIVLVVLRSNPADVLKVTFSQSPDSPALSCIFLTKHSRGTSQSRFFLIESSGRSCGSTSMEITFLHRTKCRRPLSNQCKGHLLSII